MSPFFAVIGHLEVPGQLVFFDFFLDKASGSSLSAPASVYL
jgi:hypothetical protein